mgnify:FL=1
MLNDNEITLLKKARKVKPIVKQKKGFISKMVFIEPEEICACGYADFSTPVCEVPKLVKIGTFDASFKESGYKGYFKPNIADALKYIPAVVVEDAVAFEVKDAKHDFCAYGHVPGKVIVYRLAKGETMPKDVANQDVRMGGQKYTAREIDRMTYSKNEKSKDDGRYFD